MGVRIVGFHDYAWDAEVPVHRRTHGAIMLVTGGGGSISVAARDQDAPEGEESALKSHRVVPGDVVVYLPYEDHGYSPDSGAALNVTAVNYEYDASSDLGLHLHGLKRRRHFRALPVTAALFEAVREHYASGREFCLRAAESIVESMLFAMIGESDRRRASDRTSPVDEAMELLFSEHGARLTAIAEKLGVSPDAIRKEFRRHFDDTPRHYFTSYRVSHVARRLISSDMPLRELAEEFGFYDEFHMSRVFKREMGIAPSEYRARHRP